MKKRLLAINEQNEEVDFGFVGKYRTQTDVAVSWNYEGKKLFERIPCSKCKQLFTEKELRDNNYYL
jgi:hypothetical protein